MHKRPVLSEAVLICPPFTDSLPDPIFFRIENPRAYSRYPELCHPWGEFVYSFSGITEVYAEGKNYLIPPQMGMWLAPHTPHTAFSHQASLLCSVYVSAELCADMPEQGCAMLVSPLLRNVLEYLRDTRLPASAPEYQRLLLVLVDQLKEAPTTNSYIPHSNDPDLENVLAVLRNNPADSRSLSELAQQYFHGSERTLIRRCQQELGMSLTQWRQRLRLIHALPRLQQGQSVEAVALDMGYATSSAFIAMFRRLTGCSPRQFLRDACHALP